MEEDTTPKTKSVALCLCGALKPLLMYLKIFGICPISATHRNGECLFEISKCGVIWSIAVLCILVFPISLYIDTFELFSKEKSDIDLHSMLVNVVSVIYCLYAFTLTLISILKTRKVVVVMNKIYSVIKEGLLCQSALNVILNVQHGFMAIALLTVMIQLLALMYLNFSEDYETNFDYKILVSQFLQSVTFVFYITFLSYCTVFMGMFACLEKMILYAFQFQSVHPSEKICETNNVGVFIAISYKLCKSDHTNRSFPNKYRRHEIIDYFRCLHEKISVLMYDCNDCISIQLLCHMTVELAVLIINYYAVVIYFVHDFHTPISSTFHFLNCLFVVLHTLGIFIFLRNSQQLQNMIKGLIPILLEYSTRARTSDERQHIRLFTEKLKHHRPITASSVVNIDLSIAGPICANILTYVLVALQFDVQKD